MRVRRRRLCSRQSFGPPSDAPCDSSTAHGLPLPQASVWRADPKGGQQEILEPAMLIGLGAVAAWTYLNQPRLWGGGIHSHAEDALRRRPSAALSLCLSRTRCGESIA